MALSTSNTFILTSAGTAIATSRSHWNGSFQALVQNFYSEATPVAANFVDDGGSAVAFTDSRTYGLLYYSSKYRALYVNEPTANKKGGEGPGGNFTRVGLGVRYEPTIAQATTNIAQYQVGELVFVHSASTDSTGANSRIYVKKSNTALEWKDVGEPHPASVTSTMLAASAVTEGKIATGAVTSAKILDATITNADLDAHTKGGLVPIGTILPYGGSSAPTSYVLCDGTSYNSTTAPQYANLFSVIGTTFGGSGAAAFNVPDFRDRLPLGKGSNNSSLGATVHAMSASSTKTSVSTSISSHSVGTGTFATSAKDSSTSTAITQVADHSAIAPNMIFPTVTVNYIIRF